MYRYMDPRIGSLYACWLFHRGMWDPSSGPFPVTGGWQHFHKDGDPLFRGMGIAFPTDGTPSPRDGNPFTEGCGPTFQAMETKGWGPLYRRMGTPFPRDGDRFVSGWQGPSMHIFNESDPTRCLGSYEGGGQNASPTPVNAWRKTFSTGSRPPTWRETLGSIYPVTP